MSYESASPPDVRRIYAAISNKSASLGVAGGFGVRPPAPYALRPPAPYALRSPAPYALRS